MTYSKERFSQLVLLEWGCLLPELVISSDWRSSAMMHYYMTHSVQKTSVSVAILSDLSGFFSLIASMDFTAGMSSTSSPIPNLPAQVSSPYTFDVDGQLKPLISPVRTRSTGSTVSPNLNIDMVNMHMNMIRTSFSDNDLLGDFDHDIYENISEYSAQSDLEMHKEHHHDIPNLPMHKPVLRPFHSDQPHFAIASRSGRQRSRSACAPVPSLPVYGGSKGKRKSLRRRIRKQSIQVA